MSKSYSHGFGVLRFLAMLCIVVCHILQQAGDRLAFYLNIGVPVFLCISGYIFGSREISGITGFYKARGLRILIPYYLLLTITVAANVLTGTMITLKECISSLLCQQWYGPSVPNCGHLWYITCILVCYLITPALQWICNALHKKGVVLFWSVVFCGVALLLGLGLLGGYLSGIYFFAAYILGYTYANHIKNSGKPLCGVLIAAALVLSSTGFVGLYALERMGIAYPGIVLEYYKIGFSAVICLGFLWKSCWFSGSVWKPLIDFGDRYSYTVYLTHHLFILGPLSVMSLQLPGFVNILIALGATVTSAVVLQKVTAWSNSVFGKRRKML